MTTVRYPSESAPLIEVVGDHGERIVAIHRDGTVTFGEGVDLDEASRRFWKALADTYPKGIL